jgi:hypothetical protein
MRQEMCFPEAWMSVMLAQMTLIGRYFSITAQVIVWTLRPLWSFTVRMVYRRFHIHMASPFICGDTCHTRCENDT